MAILQHKNNAKTTINDTGGIDEDDTEVIVTSGAVFPASGDFMATIWDAATYPDPGDDSGMEIVKVTARSTNTLTIVRAQEGTAGVAHADGETIAMLITAWTADELRLYGPVLAKTGTYTLTVNDYLVTADAVGGDFTLTLPAAATAGIGKIYIIKNISDVWGEDVTIDGNASETIDGAATYVLYGGQFETLKIICDGSNWQII
jgi:hypothetical protein